MKTLTPEEIDDLLLGTAEGPYECVTGYGYPEVRRRDGSVYGDPIAHEVLDYPHARLLAAAPQLAETAQRLHAKLRGLPDEIEAWVEHACQMEETHNTLLLGGCDDKEIRAHLKNVRALAKHLKTLDLFRLDEDPDPQETR